jgi:hypothetical protein
MGGNTGNLRTLRISATGGYRTFTSLVADGASAGAGSMRRVYGYYTRNGTVNEFYKKVFDINYGQFKSRSMQFI